MLWEKESSPKGRGKRFVRSYNRLQFWGSLSFSFFFFFFFFLVLTKTKSNYFVGLEIKCLKKQFSKGYSKHDFYSLMFMVFLHRIQLIYGKVFHRPWGHFISTYPKFPFDRNLDNKIQPCHLQAFARKNSLQ